MCLKPPSSDNSGERIVRKRICEDRDCEGLTPACGCADCECPQYLQPFLGAEEMSSVPNVPYIQNQYKLVTPATSKKCLQMGWKIIEIMIRKCVGLQLPHFLLDIQGKVPKVIQKASRTL